MGTAQKQNNDTQSYVDELAPGSTLLHGQYTIKKFLNSGGFGITYLASNSLDRDVVIKECFPSAFCHRSRSIVQVRSRAHTAELKSIVDLFVQEARSLARLDHPNIVGVHEVFEDNDTAYMVLDFVEGRDLLDVLEDPDHGLSAEQIKGILQDVLSAVDFIHRQDILHRDISPDNILLDADLRPVLIDFGAAREEATKQSRVLSALRVVKDGYSPQEFYVQGSLQSPSSDLYALGATFYHLIMGETPPNSQARLAAIASGEKDLYEPLINRVTGFDRRFLMAIDKSLGILPKDRVQSAQEWLDLMNGTRRKSRVVTQQVPMSSAAAATLAAETKSSKLVPLFGSVAVIALVAVGAGVATGSFSGSDAPVAETATSSSVTKVATADPVDAPAPVVAQTPVTAPETTAAAPEPEVVQAPEVTVATAAPEVAAPIETPASAVETAQAPIAEEIPTDTVIAAAPVVPEIAPEPVLSDVAPVVQDAVAPLASEPTVLADVIELEAAPAPVVAIPRAVAALETPREDRLALAEELTIPPAAPVDVTPPEDVTTAWSVRLPFAGQEGSNTIGTVDFVAPAWALRGVEVLAVNGTPISSMAEINTVLTETQTPQESGVQPVVFTIRTAADAEPVDQPWQVAVVQETRLLNGMTFTTKVEGDTWVTRVANRGASQTELQVGDMIVGYVPTSETLSERTSLSDILQREIEAGTETYSFAVKRDGSIWVASMTYVDPASVPTQ